MEEYYIYYESLSSISCKERIDLNKEGRLCIGRWDNWWFFVDINNEYESFMWHKNCHIKIQLPLLHNFRDLAERVFKCLVSPSTHHEYEDDHLCAVSLFFREELYFLTCRPPCYSKWEKVVIFENNIDSRLCDVVSLCYGDKICTLSSNGKLGMIRMNSRQIISTCLPSSFKTPTDSNAMYRKRHLVSWQDQLFLVQQKRGSNSGMQVWKADFGTQQFNRIFNLDGIVIVLSKEFSAAISSSRNCVYFTDDRDNYTLYAFHIADQILSISTNEFRFCTHDNWRVPLLERLGITEDIGEKMKRRSSSKYVRPCNILERVGRNNQPIIGDEVKRRSYASHCNTLERVGNNNQCNTGGKVKRKPSSKYHNRRHNTLDSNICSHLPLDLQRKIFQYLLSQDTYSYMNFRSVCKLWKSIAPPLRWRVNYEASNSSGIIQDSIWLLSLNQEDGSCTFYNPFRNLNRYTSNSNLVGCEILYSNDGWLLVSRGSTSLFLLQPFSGQIIHLPERTQEYYCDTMSFSASPTNASTWVIFGIASLNCDQVRISYLRAGDDGWTSLIMLNETEFLLSCSSPVYFGEEFCVIDEWRGNVGAFGFSQDGNPYWVIHQIGLLYSPHICGACLHFLVPRDQNVIYSIIVGGQTREQVRVYELDLRGQRQAVTLVKEVKDWLLFVSEASSLAVSGMNTSLDDALLFPCFSCSTDDYVYYSLEAAEFKVLKDNSTHKWQQKELLGRVWIRCEPGL